MRPQLGQLAGGAVLATVSALLLGGCFGGVGVGGDSGASGEEIADEIGGDYSDRTGIELTALTCEDVDAKAGERFRCSGRNERGVRLQIVGRVTGTEAGGFDYAWHVSKAIAPGVLYERALRRQLEARGLSIAEIRCPPEIEVRRGAKLRCRATDVDGVDRGVAIVLTDRDGGFEFSVGGAAPPPPESASTF